MNRLLANLCTVPGVLGAAVYDHFGACLEHRLESAYEPDRVGTLLDELLVGLEAYEYLERASFRFGMANYEYGVVGVMRTRHHRAIVFATNNINPSLLTVAFGALEVKLARLSQTPTQSSTRPRSPTFSAEQSEAGALGPGEVVPAAAMRAALDGLAEQVGPVAQVLVNEQLDISGFDPSAVPRTAWPELIENLAREIDDVEQRRVFVKRVLPLS